MFNFFKRKKANKKSTTAHVIEEKPRSEKQIVSSEEAQPIPHIAVQNVSPTETQPVKQPAEAVKTTPVRKLVSTQESPSREKPYPIPKEMLPIGSVVKLRGEETLIMIAARVADTKVDGKPVRFDYAGVEYPRGYNHLGPFLFNGDKIEKVCFMGYSDDDDKLMVEFIKKRIAQVPLPKGDPYELNKAHGLV